MNTKTTARDFFLHLGAIVSFYASVVALITLLFEVINFSYPKITDTYSYAFPSISFQVATLIVALPLFFVLSRVLQKSYIVDPSLKEVSLRKWLGFITIFISGAVVAGDLVAVIYTFLDGQELTTAFLLKVLVLLVISLGIFFYYLREIKNLISDKERNAWRIFALALTLGSIILGFSVIGSPKTQREYKYDMQKISDLQNIQWQVINYYQLKNSLPKGLTDLNDSLKPGAAPNDSQSGEPYVYKATGNLSFELCANFNRETRKGIPADDKGIAYRTYYYDGLSSGDNWDHKAGEHCFSRTIDPQLYPQIKR